MHTAGPSHVTRMILLKSRQTGSLRGVSAAALDRCHAGRATILPQVPLPEPRWQIGVMMLMMMVLMMAVASGWQPRCGGGRLESLSRRQGCLIGRGRRRHGGRLRVGGGSRYHDGRSPRPTSRADAAAGGHDGPLARWQTRR
jgi:hypothetical protein